MKKHFALVALALLATACTQTTANNTGMMNEMQCCKMMMKDGKECPCCKDGKMKQGMSAEQMQQCEGMMKQCDMMKGGMMQGGMKDMKPADAAKAETPKADDADHKAHHPAK